MKEDNVLYDPNDVEFWKRQNYGDSKEASGAMSWVGRRMNRQSTEDFKAVKEYYTDGHISLCICHNP